MFLRPKIVIIGSTTLRVLNVGRNKIYDDGISMISKELQNNSLTTLTVQQCELSVKGKQTKNYTLCLNKYCCLIVSTKLVCLAICTLYITIWQKLE